MQLMTAPDAERSIERRNLLLALYKFHDCFDIFSDTLTFFDRCRQKGGKALGWNQETKRNDKTITDVCENEIIINSEDNRKIRTGV